MREDERNETRREETRGDERNARRTLAVQQRHRRSRLEAPQRLHAATLLQIQQLDQEDRVDVQEAAAAPRPDGAARRRSGPAATTDAGAASGGGAV